MQTQRLISEIIGKTISVVTGEVWGMVHPDGRTDFASIDVIHFTDGTSLHLWAKNTGVNFEVSGL